MFNIKYYSDLVWKQRECHFSKKGKRHILRRQDFFYFFLNVTSMFVSVIDYWLKRPLRNVQVETPTDVVFVLLHPGSSHKLASFI